MASTTPAALTTPLLDHRAEDTMANATPVAEAASPQDLQNYLTDRAALLWPVVWTSRCMVVLGVVTVVFKLRVGKHHGVLDETDETSNWSTICINLIVLLMLGMVHRSDTSMTTPNECPCLGDKITWWSARLSVLMPVNDIIALIWFEKVPVHDSDKLPWWLNLMFWMGLLAYVFAGLWLLGSAMRRSVQQTWCFRAWMLEEIEKATTAQDWDQLVHEMIGLDHKLETLWAVNNAGGLWVAAVFSSWLIAAFAAANVFDNYRINASYAKILTDERQQLFFFLLSIMWAVGLGLVLASTAFVSPFWFANKDATESVTNQMPSPDAAGQEELSQVVVDDPSHQAPEESSQDVAEDALPQDPHQAPEESSQDVAEDAPPQDPHQAPEESSQDVAEDAPPQDPNQVSEESSHQDAPSEDPHQAPPENPTQPSANQGQVALCRGAVLWLVQCGKRLVRCCAWPFCFPVSGPGAAAQQTSTQTRAPSAPSAQRKIHTSCVLTKAMISTVDHGLELSARVERARFTQCANQMCLGAKLCGIAITKALVLRIYIQIVVVAPTLFTVLQAAAARSHQDYLWAHNLTAENTAH